MSLLFAILNLCIVGLILALVLVLIEWVLHKIADVPAQAFIILRAIFALIFIGYLLALLMGAGSAPMFFPLRQ